MEHAIKWYEYLKSFVLNQAKFSFDVCVIRSTACI